MPALFTILVADAVLSGLLLGLLVPLLRSTCFRKV